MRRALLLIGALGLIPAAAPAQEAAPAAAPLPPICTTTTVVVKRGDVVLSSSSKTKCEDQATASADDGGGFHPTEVLKAPGEALKSMISSEPLELKVRLIHGDWRVVQRGNQRICKLTLSQVPGAAGYPVRTLNCEAPLAGVKAYKLEDNAVVLMDASGGVVTRLIGDQNRLASTGGQDIVLQR